MHTMEQAPTHIIEKLINAKRFIYEDVKHKIKDIMDEKALEIFRTYKQLRFIGIGMDDIYCETGLELKTCLLGAVDAILKGENAS